MVTIVYIHSTACDRKKKQKLKETSDEKPVIVGSPIPKSHSHLSTEAVFAKRKKQS